MRSSGSLEIDSIAARQWRCSCCVSLLSFRRRPAGWLGWLGREGERGRNNCLSRCCKNQSALYLSTRTSLELHQQANAPAVAVAWPLFTLATLFWLLHSMQPKQPPDEPDPDSCTLAAAAKEPLELLELLAGEELNNSSTF